MGPMVMDFAAIAASDEAAEDDRDIHPLDLLGRHAARALLNDPSAYWRTAACSAILMWSNLWGKMCSKTRPLDPQLSPNPLFLRLCLFFEKR
ncbi:hypothetical protein RA2_01690 [Roseovarius sp. A-2]|nr:hypothetical protein RA2_01690 [Roseovarius sp. A-2]